MQKWEYLEVSTDFEKDQWRPTFANGAPVADYKKTTMAAYANLLGSQGWELVSVTVSTGAYGGVGNYKYFFKRPAEG